MRLKLSIAIQHHPGRDGTPLYEGLRADLTAAEVVVDPGHQESFPSPWRTYRAALERTPPSASHRLVLQDDVIISLNFAQAVRRAIRAQPDRPICFFVAGNPFQHANAIFSACDQGLPFAELQNETWCPAIATCWPASMIDPMLRWVDLQAWPPQFRADDEILGRWLREARVRALASVPSLVEHPDTVTSLVGRRAAGGQDPSRVSCCFIGDCDPLTIDWNAGVRSADHAYI